MIQVGPLQLLIKNFTQKNFKDFDKNFLSIYAHSGKKIFARQQLEDIYIRNGIFYIFKISKLIKSKHIYLKKLSINYKLSKCKYR